MELTWMLIFIILVILLVSSTYRNKHRPPGPLLLPLLGCFFQFRSLWSRLGYFHLVWSELARQYGPLVGLKLGKDRIVIVSGFEAAKHVLTRDDCDGRPRGFVFSLRTYGKRLGILLADGEEWKEQRRFCTLHLKNLGLKGESMEKIILHESCALVEHIRERCRDAEGAELSLHDLCGVSVVNNLWAVVAGTRFDFKDERLLQLLTLLNEFFSAVDMTGGVLNQMPFLRYIAPERTGYNHMMSTIAALQAYLGDEIQEHGKTLQTDDTRDLIDAYLQHNEKYQGDTTQLFSEQQLMAVLLDFFMAGAETTNNTLGFALLYMLHNPEVQRRVQQQIDDVVGRERQVTSADRANLTYVEAVLMEVQRMATVLPSVAHYTLKDCDILGHRVNQDTMLIVNLYSVLMDPEYWGDPEVFRPERFLDSTGEKLIKDERLIPFGIGKRRCLGENLARSSLFLFFTALMQNFNFEVAPGQQPPSLLPVDGITLSPIPFTGMVTSRK